jgi:predicted acylesterase/phospholipase RssA
MGETASLQLLRSARRVGVVLSGGAARCAFQVGVLETLDELGIRPALCVGVSAGVWNGAALAVGALPRLRFYWRCFIRMPALAPLHLFSERAPGRYIGAERLTREDALPLFVGVTRLADRRPMVFSAREVEDPLALLLASNHLPPFFGKAPVLAGERYGDGGLSDNLPYETAFAEGCDAAVLVTMKGESEGGIYKSPDDVDHQIPPELAPRCVVVRPRHRMPLAFAEKRLPLLTRAMDLGRLRTREVLLGETHPDTEWRAQGTAPTAILARLRRRAPIVPIPR